MGRDPVHANPRLYLKLQLINIVIFSDIIVDAYVEPIHNDDFVAHMLAFSLQVFVRLSTVMAFFALTSDTMYIKTTQYGSRPPRTAPLTQSLSGKSWVKQKIP